MANLVETPSYEPGIYQIELGDPVLGGPPNLGQSQGISNVATQQLANRTAWLKQQVDGIPGAYATPQDITNAINALLDGAPGALNTLNEIAAAINDDPNFAATLTAIAQSAVPIGAEISWTGSTPPTYFLEEDRSSLSRASYPALWAHAQASGMLDATGTDTGMFGPGDGATTFQLPDARAEFIRGWDHGRGIDAGRNLGSAQLDAFQGHFHEGLSGDNQTFPGGEYGRGSNTANGHGFKTTGPITDGTNGAPRTASETRPRNVSRMICIRAY